MLNSLYATFPNTVMAEKAIGALLDHGATAECISLVADDKAGHDSPVLSGDRTLVDEASHGITTTTGGDAAAGAIKGAGIGLGVGALAALASLIIPGFGLVIGGGALALALGAAAATTAAGAVAGGVAGYLIDQGVPDRVALTYQEELAAGRALLAVQLPCGQLDRDEVNQLLDKYGAANIGAFPLTGSGIRPLSRAATSTPLVPRAPDTVPMLEQPVVADTSMFAANRSDAFTQHFNDNYQSRGLTFSEVAPAYEFGFTRGQDPRFGTDDYMRCQDPLQAEWELLHPGTFDTMSQAIRFGWERARIRQLW